MSSPVELMHLLDQLVQIRLLGVLASVYCANDALHDLVDPS